MRFSSILALAGLASLSQAGGIKKRNYEANDYYVLHLRSVDPEHVASRLGLDHHGQLGTIPDHHIFRAPLDEKDVINDHIEARKRRKRDLSDDDEDIIDSIVSAQKQYRRRPFLEKRSVPPPPPTDSFGFRGKKEESTWVVDKQNEVIRSLNIPDPKFTSQWHLLNTAQPGHDINVTGVWLEGITGKNVTVAIIDDGLDMYSNDLKDNYYAEGSYDFNRHDPEPKPETEDDKHGTRCAGEIGAGRNDVCGLGVAYDSKIAGLQMLSGDLSTADEAEAMMYENQKNMIYSCSWGPPDDGAHMIAPDVLVRKAMVQSIKEGRGGKGSIYVFASGNGAASGDNCNFDGYTNSIFSITVAAVDRLGQHPHYSEHCSANLIVAYSSGSGSSIFTTDVGADKCATNHGGTSAAAPIGAGVFALVLQIRPDLTWRDMQYLAVYSAIPVDPVDGKEEEYQTTAIQKRFSHVFGYGKIDTYAIVQLAKTWELVKPQSWFFSPWLHVKQHLPQGDKGISTTFEVTKDMLKEANLERLEHVTVTMNVKHTNRGDISVDLISPSGVVSHLAVTRSRDKEKSGYNNWTFMSVAHWGESGIGEWTLHVKDTEVNENAGFFEDWHLKLWGESIDAKNVKELPLPDANEDANHDQEIPVQTAQASTATSPPNPEETHSHEQVDPTEQPERPTKPAPQPTATTPSDDSEEATSSGVAQETTEASSSWISWLPNFGASKTAQIWIYGAIGLILAFCCGLGIYLFFARRRRMRNDTRNNYEFELLDEEEAEGLNSGDAGAAEKGAAGGRRSRRTRGGELYDAFAGESDEEDDQDDRDEPSDDPDRFKPYSDRDEQRRPADRLHGEEQQFALGDESDESDDDNEKAETRPLR